MSVLLFLISLLLILFLLFTLIPLRIRLFYLYQGKNNNLWLEIKLWPGIYVYRKLFLVNKFKNKRKKQRHFLRLRKIYQFITYFVPLLPKLLPVTLNFSKKVKPQQLYWQTVVGLSDASLTGMAVGWIWSIKGLILALLYHLLGLPATKPVIIVKPDFSKTVFVFLINGAFTVRTGHLLTTSIRVMVIFLSYFLSKFLSKFFWRLRQKIISVKRQQAKPKARL